MMDEDLLLDKLKAIEDSIDSVQDVEKLTELDIINLKNEIEKLKIGTNSFVPEDVEEKIVKIAKLAENTDIFEEWKKAVDEIKVLRKMVDDLSKGVPAGSTNLKNEIESLKKMVSSQPTEVSGHDYSTNISEIVQRLDEIEQNVRSIKPIRIPQIPNDINKYSDSINSLNEKLNSAIRDIEIMKKKGAGTDSKPLPPIGIDVDELKNSVALLETEIDSIKKSTDNNKIDGMETRIDALYTKLDNISSEKSEQANVDYSKDISSLRNDIESLSLSLEVMPTSKDITRINSITDKTQNEIKNIKSALNTKSHVPTYDKDIKSLKTDVSKLSKTINDLSLTLSSPDIDFENDIDQRIKGMEESIKKLSTKQQKPRETSEMKKLKTDIASLSDALNNMITKKDFEEFEENLIPPQIPTSEDLQNALKKGIMLEKDIKEINRKSKEFELFLKRKDELDQLAKTVQGHTKTIEKFGKDLRSLSQSRKDIEDFKVSKKKINENSKKIDNVMNELGAYIKSQKTKSPAPPSSMPDKKVGELFERMHRNEKSIENMMKRFSETTKKINDISSTTKKGVVVSDEQINDIHSRLSDNSKNIEMLISDVGRLSSVSKVLPSPKTPMAQNTKDVTKMVDRMAQDMNTMKKSLEQKFNERNAREFENDIYKELETMNRGIKRVLDENKEYMKKVSVDVSHINDRILQVEKKSDGIRNLNAERIAQDLESVKTKQKWIENNIENFNIDPLHDKLNELERKINSLRVSSPLVIE